MMGNVIVIQYPRAFNRENEEYKDVVFRYFHLSSISVKKGQAVDKDTVLGYYGSTGMLDIEAHLHLEADIDLARPLHSPSVLRSNLIKGTAQGASEETLTNPLSWLHVKESCPDYQSYKVIKDAYIHEADMDIPACR